MTTTPKYRKLEDRPDGGLVYEVTVAGEVVGKVRKVRRRVSLGMGGGRRVSTGVAFQYRWDARRPDGERSPYLPTRARATEFLTDNR